MQDINSLVYGERAEVYPPTHSLLRFQIYCQLMILPQNLLVWVKSLPKLPSNNWVHLINSYHTYCPMNLCIYIKLEQQTCCCLPTHNKSMMWQPRGARSIYSDLNTMILFSSEWAYSPETPILLL